MREPYSNNEQGLQWPVELAVGVIGLLAVVFSIWGLVGSFSSKALIEWSVLAGVTMLMVSRVDIRIPNRPSRVSLSDTFIFIAVFRFGVYGSVLLAVLESLSNALQVKERRRSAMVNAASVGLSAFISSQLVSFLFADINTATVGIGELALVALVLAVSFYTVNVGLTSLMTSLRERRPASEVLQDIVPWSLVSLVIGTLATTLVVKLIAVTSFWAFITSLPILMITYHTYKVYLDKVETSNRHAEEMADLHLRTIEALAIAIDAKDEVTHDHVRRVQIYATGLARMFGLSDPEIEALKAGALLHDIGKLAVPDYILNKPGILTPAEFEKMKVHTIVGAEILERVGFPYPVVPVVRHHHERWDGRGYPDSLKGDEIPMTARILTVSDCFDAVREERQYRKAMTRGEAIAMLKEGSGTVFDPAIIAAFLDHLDDFESQIREEGVERASVGAPLREGGEQAAGSASAPMVYERIRSAHREVIALYDIAQTIGTSLDLRDTFAVFSSRLEDIVSYTTCVLYLVRTDSTEVEAAHVAGRDADRLKGKSLPSGAGITGWVVANRHAMHNCDPRLDFDVLKVETPDAYKTATVVPLMRDGAILGALALYSAELTAYTSDHLRLMEAVAKLASDAIANAVKHERTETSALTDPLTGLPNARALRYRFEEEADRARRHRDTFAIVMMDLDGFKAVNDGYGHQAGDLVLKELSVLLHAHVRSNDFVSRYAGDEFVAVLQVGTDEVEELARRIQTAVDRHQFGFAGSKVSVGVSVGWACFGHDGDTIDTLLLAADRAMYADKAKRKAAFNQDARINTSDLGQFPVM
ncbi:MAG TPA: diguanylate cyclase [Blastocatellia bacterium]|nr:diguanylate cyclase [Blastocatellia bacterium]